jgi:hypothetical protein
MGTDEKPEPLNRAALDRAYIAVFTAITEGRNHVAAAVLRDLAPENLTELAVICGDVRTMAEAAREGRK